MYGANEIEKTVVSIGEDLQEHIFHYFIHPAEELLPERGGVLAHLFRDLAPVSTPETQRSQKERNINRTYEWVSLGNTNDKFISVTYLVNGFPCKLIFYPLTALRKRNFNN